MGWKDAPVVKQGPSWKQAPLADTASLGDQIAGHPLTRFAMGAASPLIGSAQLGAHIGDWINQAMSTQPVVSPWIDKQIAAYEAAKQRGMKAAGKEGFDWMGLAGNLVPAGKVATATAKMLPEATGILGKMGIGAATGGAVAATTPVTQGEFGPEKAMQTTIGGILGGILPLAQKTVESGVQFGRNLAEPFLEHGRATMLKRYQEHLLGDNPTLKDKVIRALLGAKELVPGSQPTAGQVLTEIPEATGLASQQASLAKTKGLSPLFKEREAAQAIARKVASKARDAVTEPMRENALQQAGQSGNLKVTGIIQDMEQTLNKPGLRVNDTVQSSLTTIKNKLEKAADANGVIHPDDLYEIRKKIGTTIKKHAGENVDWDKKLASGLERDIQKAMDTAIENAGGTGWKDYLKEFSLRSQAIKDDLQRQKDYLKMARGTNIGGAEAIHEGTTFPNLLSRPAMVANFVIRKMGIEPAQEKINKMAAQQMLNPEQLAINLRGNLPSKNQMIAERMIEQMKRQSPGLAALLAARNF